MKISTILEKKYDYMTSYQRDEAWTKKNQQAFIDSLMNGYYIPELIVANGEVVDGKQRIRSLEHFVNNEIPWINFQTHITKYYRDLSWDEKTKFQNTEIAVKDLGPISDADILETFIRINVGSIKLNKAELRLAQSKPENREIIKKIAANSSIQKIANGKKNDSRFKIEELITRCLAILHMPKTKKGVRSYMLTFLRDEELDPQIVNDSNQTLDLMAQILDNDTIPIKSFNTVFEAIFCAFYQKRDSKNNFLKEKMAIKNQISAKIEEIGQDQMGGGVKFDSMNFINKRIQKITLILENYQNDPRRSFNYEEKLKLWNSKAHVCELCRLVIYDINDFEIDHLQPHTIGGATEITNARLLCRSCNRQAGVRLREEIKTWK